MISRLAVVFAILLFLSITGNARGSSDETSEGLSTPAAYFQYKVKALNTALYYILQALHDDLADSIEVDVSFLKRINIIIVKIKSFYGKVDETNALMLGELLKALPGYLNIKMELAGLNFADYTAMPSTDSLGTISTSETSTNTDNTNGEFSADNAEETDNTDEQDSADSVDSDGSND